MSAARVMRTPRVCRNPRVGDNARILGNPRVLRLRARRALSALLLVASAILPACITFRDTEGVVISDEDVAALRPGTTTRGEVLERFGPPTGIYRTRIVDAFLRDVAFAPPSSTGRVDDDVLVWQRVTLEGSVLFVPVLLTWARADVTARTLMVVFDEDERVLDVAFREDGR